MTYRLIPWEKDTPPSRNDLHLIYASEGLTSYGWSNGPGDAYSAHSHRYEKVLYCLTGSIVFHLDGESVELKPGDRLEVDPEAVHSANVGPDGVECMEAAREP